jgi:uncharacterized protein (DUF58 family)
MTQERSQEIQIFVADRHARTTAQRDARSRMRQQLLEGKMPTFEDMAAARGLVIREREHSIFSDAWVPLAVLFIIGGLIASRNLALLALGAVLLLIVLISSWWKSNALVGVDYEREFDRMRVFPGEPIQLKLRVSNQKPLPLTWLQFEDRLPIPPVEEGLLAEVVGDTAGYYTLQTNFSISGHGRIERDYTLIFKRRGYYQVGPVRHRSGDLFTMFTVEREYSYLENIVIYPPVYPLEALGLPPKEPFGELPVRRSLFTDPIHTQGIRDYQPSDRFRDVHWKASARRGDLQTKIYEPSTGMTVAIFLNVATFERHWMGFDPEILERAISVAASIAAYAAEEKWGLGLFVNGSVPRSDQPIRVPPGRSPDQLAHVLEALAATTEFATGSIERLMQRESPRLPWIATLVLVTANVSETMAVTLTRLKEAGRRVCLVCLADELPDYMPPVLTYHVPTTTDAFQNGHTPGDSRLASTQAALGNIPAPDNNGTPPNSRWERTR